MRCIASPFASRSEPRRLAIALVATAVIGCADTFTLPPVPEAEIPAAGAYNLDRVWNDMGAVSDFVLGGGLLYTLTERPDGPHVEVWFPEAGAATLAPTLIAGQPVRGPRRPVAIARSTDPLNGTLLFVADARGPDPMSTHVTCGRGAGCVLTIDAEHGGAPAGILARPFEEPAPGDFTLSARMQLTHLSEPGAFWILVGTAPGRIGVWLEIDAAGLIRPVRSDGAFPIPTLPFSFDTWHDLDVTFNRTDREYAVTVDGELLDEDIRVYHPLNAPVEILGFRTDADAVTLTLDDVLITTATPDTLLALDFEDPEDGEGWVPGPYFTNDPAPAVFKYTVNREETTLRRTYTDPAWTSIGGIAVDGDLTLYVSVDERDPADPTGVLRRGQVQRFAADGSRLDPLAQTGAGLGFVTEPRALDYDGEYLVVVDEFLNRAQVLDPDVPGAALVSLPPLGAAEPWFSGPTEVTTDEDRFIYVADTRNHRVMRYTPEGAFADTVYSRTYVPTEAAGDILFPSAIAADADEVWLADPATGRVVVLKRSGQIAGGG